MSLNDVEEFRKARYFPVLDGLRAISVFLVLLVHLKDKTLVLRHVPGWLGVDIFFVLSGFLITTLLLREHESSGAVNYKAFYVRRLFRIVPIYLVILLAYCAVCYNARGGAAWGEFRSGLPYYAVFLNEFARHNIPFSYSWTLGIEEKFYLLWPCVAFALCNSLRARIWTGFILAGACLFLPFQFGRSYLGLLLGAGLALLLASDYANKLARLVQRIPVFVPSIAVLIGFALVDYNEKFVLVFDIAIVALISHLLLASSRGRLILGHRSLTWFGKRSYSMYLVHSLVLNLVVAGTHPKTTISQSITLLLAYLATSVVANVLYLVVEEPARNFGRRLLKPPQAAFALTATN